MTTAARASAADTPVCGGWSTTRSRRAVERWPEKGGGGTSAEQQHDHLGHAGRLGLTLDLDDVVGDHLLAGGDVGERGEGRRAPDAGADLDRVGEAHLVEAVIEPGAGGLDTHQLGVEHRDQREREISVRDGPSEGPRLGALDVDVDPLVVVGGVGELVDTLLGDLEPVGGPDLLADRGFELSDVGEGAHVGPPWLPDRMTAMSAVLTEPSAGPPVTREQVRRAPKVLLHDHLDGGLRPATIVELAAEVGPALPASSPAELGTWFTTMADSGSLVEYLETFDHTVGVMQTASGLARVARECVEDLAADGVVYAEVRYAPEQHVTLGLSLDEVVSAVHAGFEEGMASTGITVRQLLTAMRHQARSREIAELSIAWRDRGVAGFDIAGAEAGYPPTRHLDAFEYLQRENSHFTIHAGEAFGLPSIWEAIQWCGADRLGHGVRIIDDIKVSVDGEATLGKLAGYVRDTRVPLEMCPTSNVNTGICASIAEHPIGLLAGLGFRVTVNTDNRLMSNVILSQELHKVAEAFDSDWQQIRWFTVNAMKSA